MDCEGGILLGSEHTCDYLANKLPEVVPSSSLDSAASGWATELSNQALDLPLLHLVLQCGLPALWLLALAE
jgi:hypothetical protein